MKGGEGRGGEGRGEEKGCEGCEERVREDMREANEEKTMRVL